MNRKRVERIHPDDAAALGKDDSDEVEVLFRVGGIRLPAEITADIMPGVVSVPHGWGHDRDGVALHVARASGGESANDLTDDAVIDVLSGNAAFSGVPVRFSRNSGSALENLPWTCRPLENPVNYTIL